MSVAPYIEPVSSKIESGLRQVRDRMREACEAAGRSPNDVQLIAVTKTKPIEDIRAAYELGIRDFGENYVQELMQKADALRDLDINWHYIGHLQRNKAKFVARHPMTLHAVDGLPLAQALSKRLEQDGNDHKVMINVNLAGEKSKSGIAAEALPQLVDEIRTLPHLELVGLFTMPPPGDPEIARPHFARLRGLAAQHDLPQLSMGMTSDLEVAIQEGATMVRVGTAIFGARERSTA